MKLETAQAIVQAATDNKLDVTLRENYSGRGMFGKTTAAVVGSRSDIMDFRWDAMGKYDSVAY